MIKTIADLLYLSIGILIGLCLLSFVVMMLLEIWKWVSERWRHRHGRCAHCGCIYTQRRDDISHNFPTPGGL
jgi:hypothetical protein